MKDLKRNELEILYNNFVVYRNTICSGYAEMKVQDFYKKFGLSPYKAK